MSRTKFYPTGNVVDQDHSHSFVSHGDYYFKNTPEENCGHHETNRQVAYVMLFCTGCGSYKEVVKADYRPSVAA